MVCWVGRNMILSSAVNNLSAVEAGAGLGKILDETIAAANALTQERLNPDGTSPASSGPAGGHLEGQLGALVTATPPNKYKEDAC